MFHLRDVAFVLVLVSTPLAAQDDVNLVSAKDPEGLASTLRNAGYEVDIGRDSVGDPRLETTLGGMTTRIMFYGCDETTNADCDSVQFVTGFDRDQPMTAADALNLSDRYRFAAVSLDDEGDPYVTWDVVMGDGIPARVFLQSVLKFSGTIGLVADVVFADE